VSDLSNAAFPQPIYRRAAVDGRGELRPELRNDALFDGRLGQRPDLRNIVAQGFLAIDVFAFLNGAVRDGKM
jgi:hypothetical protein